MTEMSRGHEQGPDSALDAFRERLRGLLFGGPTWNAFADHFHLHMLSQLQADAKPFSPTVEYQILLAQEVCRQRMNGPDGLEYRAGIQEAERLTYGEPVQRELAATLPSQVNVTSHIGIWLLDIMNEEAARRMLEMQSGPQP